MTVIQKTIGRLPVNLGDYDSTRAYGKKNRVLLYGCEWESKVNNNTYAPAALNTTTGVIAPDTTHWKLISGSYNTWLIDNGYQKLDASNVKDGNHTQHEINEAIAGEIGDDESANTIKGRITTLEDEVGTGGSVDERIAAEGDRHYLKSETYTKSEVNGMITTPDQEYKTVTATDQTTAVTDVLPATGEPDTVYRVGNWDGNQYDATAYSEYAWNESTSQYIHLSTKTQIGEVFDISAYHATGGTLATYSDLNDALNGVNGGVPQSLQKGGMSVKFVQTSDNKYVQYRLMATSFSTTPSDWQGVDAEPAQGSHNMVESGGVYDGIRNIIGDLFTVIDSTVRSNGNIEESDGFLCTDYLPITGTDDIILKGVWGSGSSTIVPLAYYNSDKEFISALTGYPSGDQDITVEKANIPQGAKFIRCTSAGIVPSRAILGGVDINSAIRYSERLHQQSVEDIQGISLNIQEIFLNLRKKKVLIPSSVTEDTVIVNGEVETNSSVDVVNYDVTEGKSYLFSGEMPSSYSGFYFITWYNNNGQVVGESAYITPSTYIVESLVVTAPAGAVTAKINRHSDYKAECWLKELDGYYADLFGSCGLLPSCNVGDVRSNGIWYLVGTNVYTDTPAQTQSGFLRVSFIDEMILQEFIELSGAGYYKRSCFNGADFGVWQQISGSGNTYRNIIGDLFTVIDSTVRSNGNIEESDGFLCTDYLPITGTDDIILKGVWGSGSSTIVPLAYYNSDKEFISALTGYPSGDQDITVEKANIPQGAKFIRCTSAGIVPSRAILGGVNINSAIRYSERLHQQSVEDMQEIFLNLRKKKVLIPSSVTEDTVIVNGEVETNSSVDVVNYDVTEGKSYLFSGEMPSSYSGFYFITWYNNNGQVVGESAYITPSTYIVESLVVTAPAGAVTAKINRHSDYKAECWLKELDGYYADLFGSCGLLPSCNVGDVRSNGIWYLVGTNVYTDTPAQAQSGFLRVSFIDEMILQEFIELSGAGYYKRSCFNGADFGVWQQISGSGNTYNVTNEFTNVEQTVNLTATPQISSDTNNYLAPSGDTTDRTADILAMLQSTGICRLGTGEYWVDSLVMPTYSTIMGSGKGTKICLKSGNDKFAIKLNSYCTVKDLCVVGSSERISLVSEIGTRHGIIWYGNFTQTQNTALQPLYGHISNLFIKGFTGGGITCNDTGTGTSNYIEASDITIENCCVGLNIYYFSEFHKFTNTACRDCYYGCINNGGNNVFINCDFSLNRGVGFLMDNSQGQSQNNSHGICVGCLFHHNRHEETLIEVNGIHIINCPNGFIFNSCQISNKIIIKDSKGVQITSSAIWRIDVTIDGGDTILLSNNIHHDPPATPINVISNQKVKVVNCYNAATGDSIGI